MNIFILEDDLLQQHAMERILLELVGKNNLFYNKIEIFSKPCQLLDAVVEKGEHQLFFLDIELQSDVAKGLEVAQEIREMDPYAAIVFVTTHTELMPLAFRYQVAALDYIDKDLVPNDFVDRLEKVLLKVASNIAEPLSDHSLTIDSPNAKFQIPINDILYIETSPLPHRLVLYTKKERLEFWGKLADIAANEPRLLQCHRSFVVNPKNVRSLDKKSRLLYFDNGSSCLVSRTKLAEMVELIQS